MQKMQRSSHTEGNEGYSAMTKALRQDPQALRKLLTARRVDVVSMMETAQQKGDHRHLDDLSDALLEIDSALDRLYATSGDTPAPVSADLYEDDGDDAQEEDDGDASSESPDDADDSEEEEEQEESDGSRPKPGPGVGLGFRQKPAEDVEGDEEDNPVKMKNKLRKQMGDSSADFLDDYALAIYDKVDEFFDNLQDKALSLGEEDEEDGENDLIEMLRDEVGKRGVARIRPVYDEWRADLVKRIMKDINDRFAPAAEDEGLEDDQMSGLLGLDEAGEDAEDAEAADEASKADDEAEPTPNADEPEEGDEEPVEASTPRLSDIVAKRASGPVSFTATAKRTEAAMATDFKPSGRGTPRLE